MTEKANKHDDAWQLLVFAPLQKCSCSIPMVSCRHASVSAPSPCASFRRPCGARESRPSSTWARHTQHTFKSHTTCPRQARPLLDKGRVHAREIPQQLSVLQELVPEESEPSGHDGEAQELNEMHKTRQAPHGTAEGLFDDIVDQSMAGNRAAKCYLGSPNENVTLMLHCCTWLLRSGGEVPHNSV